MQSQKRAHAVSMLAPPLIIDAAVYDQLHAVAQMALRSAPDVGERLLEEIERAEVLPSEQVPPTVVSIGRQVTYQDVDTGSIRTIQLVLPADADPAALRISVISPIGAALIGLSVGQVMTWQLREGEQRKLTVLAVSAPAEA